MNLEGNKMTACARACSAGGCMVFPRTGGERSLQLASVIQRRVCKLSPNDCWDLRKTGYGKGSTNSGQ